MASRKRTETRRVPAGDRPMWKPVERTAYGVVRVMKGAHKGKLGLYDDDATARMGIVYLEGAPPFSEAWVCVSRKWLRAATREEERQYEQASLNEVAVARARKARGQRPT